MQARHAFATYLTRVQQRLLAESIHTEVDDYDQANEQMVCIQYYQNIHHGVHSRARSIVVKMTHSLKWVRN